MNSVRVTPDKRLLNAAHARLYDCKDTFVYRLSTRLGFTGGVWIGYDQRSDTGECVCSEWTSILCGEFLARTKSREELKQHPVEWAIEDTSELVQPGRESLRRLRPPETPPDPRLRREVPVAMRVASRRLA